VASSASYRMAGSAASSAAVPRQQLTGSSPFTSASARTARSSSCSPARGEQVWRSTLVEELAERPIYAQGRGGLLCKQAVERYGRWGSLRTSWLAKNAVEAWRSLVTKRHASEDRRVVAEIIVDQPAEHDARSVQEYEKLIAEKNRLIEHLEQQLVSMGKKASIDERAIASAVLEAVSGLGLEQLHTEVLTGLHGLDIQSEHARKHTVESQADILRILDGRLQDLEKASVEHSRALKRLLEVSESPPLGDLLQELQREVCDDIQKHCRQFSEEVRREMIVDTQEVCLEVKALRDQQQGLYTELGYQLDADFRADLQSVRQNVGDLGRQLRTDIQADLQIVRQDVGDVLHAMQRMELKPDWSELLQAIEEVPHRITAKPESSEKLKLQPLDYEPVLAALQEVLFKFKADWSEVLVAMEKSKAQPLDLEPILAAIHEVQSNFDLERIRNAVQASSQDVLATTKACYAKQSTILELIQQIGSDCVKHSDISAALRKTRQEPDLTPVLAALRGITASFEGITAADIAPVLEAIRALERKLPCELSTSAAVLHMPESLQAMEKNIVQAIHEKEFAPLDVNRSAASISQVSTVIDPSPVLEAVRDLESSLMQDERWSSSTVIRVIEDVSARILHQLSCLRSEHAQGMQTVSSTVSSMRSGHAQGLQTVSSAVSSMSSDIKVQAATHRAELSETREETYEARSAAQLAEFRLVQARAQITSPSRLEVQRVVMKTEPQVHRFAWNSYAALPQPPTLVHQSFAQTLPESACLHHNRHVDLADGSDLLMRSHPGSCAGATEVQWSSSCSQLHGAASAGNLGTALLRQGCPQEVSAAPVLHSSACDASTVSHQWSSNSTPGTGTSLQSC